MYPAEVPFAEIKRLAGFVKEGELRNNLQQGAHDGWWVGGFLLKSTVGPPPILMGCDGDEDCDKCRPLTDGDKELLAELACCEAVTIEDCTPLPGAVGDEAAAVNPLAILAAVQQIVALLKSLGIIKKPA